ncbi:MAG: permease-like cell division protein FtsX, partial [Saprospiraceae bacterium]|nr:permease-like cell division protein FtsX [Saprospiraceae bacterium]
LFVLGLFGLIILHGQRLVDVLKERVSLIVEIEDESSRSQIDSLIELIASAPYLKKGSLRYISKEEAAETMREEFGTDTLQLDLPNPYYDVLSLNVEAEYMREDSLESIRRSLRSREIVSDVYYQENLMDTIAANMQKLAYITLGIGVFLLVIVLILIHNTVRLALYANRFIIKNMELVGASWGFISRPYLQRAVLHGFISGLLAVAALGAFLWWVQTQIPALKELQDLNTIALFFGGLVIFGILINFLSTYYVVNKYLRMRVDDLY